MRRNEPTAADRWTLARDIAVLQVKLIVDGLRDFILVPVSLVAGIISLFSGGRSRDNEFYRLLRIGRRSEQWINLFGAADRVKPATACLLYTSPSPRDATLSRMPSSA